MDDTILFRLLRTVLESSTEAMEALYLHGPNSAKLWASVTKVRRAAKRLPAMYEKKVPDEDGLE